MISFLKDWVINIVTLVLFIVLIEMLVPSGRLKKYVGLMTGVVLIIAIINPFVKVMGGKVDLTDVQAVDSSFLDRLEIEKDAKFYKDEQMKQIVEVYRKKIISQIEDSARKINGVSDAKADVIINEDSGSENFGEIKRAYVEVATEGKVGTIEPVARVDKVVVGEEGGGEGDKKGVSPPGAGGKPDDALSKEIEDKLSGLYNIDRDNIIISQQKKMGAP